MLQWAAVWLSFTVLIVQKDRFAIQRLIREIPLWGNWREAHEHFNAVSLWRHTLVRYFLQDPDILYQGVYDIVQIELARETQRVEMWNRWLAAARNSR